MLAEAGIRTWAEAPSRQAFQAAFQLLGQTPARRELYLCPGSGKTWKEESILPLIAIENKMLWIYLQSKTIWGLQINIDRNLVNIYSD